MSKSQARWLIALAIVTLSVLGARASLEAEKAENAGAYSESSQCGGAVLFRL